MRKIQVVASMGNGCVTQCGWMEWNKSILPRFTPAWTMVLDDGEEVSIGTPVFVPDEECMCDRHGGFLDMTAEEFKELTAIHLKPMALLSSKFGTGPMVHKVTKEEELEAKRRTIIDKLRNDHPELANAIFSIDEDEVEKMWKALTNEEEM